MQSSSTSLFSSYFFLHLHHLMLWSMFYCLCYLSRPVLIVMLFIITYQSRPCWQYHMMVMNNEILNCFQKILHFNNLWIKKIMLSFILALNFFILKHELWNNKKKASCWVLLSVRMTKLCLIGGLIMFWLGLQSRHTAIEGYKVILIPSNIKNIFGS